MTDLSYSTSLVPGTPENVSDVQTMFNEVKTHVNSSGWIDEDNLGSNAVTSEKVGVFPACSVYNNTALTIPNNTVTPLTCNTESFDTAAMHSTSSNTERIVFPEAGIYRVSITLTWDTASAGFRSLSVSQTGGVLGGTSGELSAIDKPSHTGTAFSQSVSALVSAPAASYILFRGWQDSGGAVTATPYISAEFVCRAS